METSMLLGMMAAAAAFACLFSAAYAGAATLTRRYTSMASQGEELGAIGLVKWRLRNGFALLMPLARWGIRFKRVADVCDELVFACASRNIVTTQEPILSVAIFLLLGVGLVLVVATSSVVCAVAVCACLCAVSYVVTTSMKDKRREAVREAVPGALESMAACFGSGFTLLQTFRQVSQDTPGYLGEVFEQSAHVLETGGSARQALDVLRDDEHASDLAFVAIALDVQHESGGSMRQVLEAASDSVKSELGLRRSLRVQTAQAKLSARIVVVMPFILVALFSLASPDFLTPFFSSVFGYALLALAVIMQVAGVFLVNRALTVEGVS